MLKIRDNFIKKEDFPNYSDNIMVFNVIRANTHSYFKNNKSFINSFNKIKNNLLSSITSEEWDILIKAFRSAELKSNKTDRNKLLLFKEHFRSNLNKSA